MSALRASPKVASLLCNLQSTLQILIKQFTPLKQSQHIALDQDIRHATIHVWLTWLASPESRTGSSRQNLNRSRRFFLREHRSQIAEGLPIRWTLSLKGSDKSCLKQQLPNPRSKVTTGGFYRPVSVWKQWSLKTSVSSISIPELPTSGDSCDPIANKLVDNTNGRKVV